MKSTNSNVIKHLINVDADIRQALDRLDNLALDAILFVVDTNSKLIGSITDGDIRRGFLSGVKIEDRISEVIHLDPKCFIKKQYSFEQVRAFREDNYQIIPVLNSSGEVINIVNFRFQKSYLPLDAVIMAGGRGERLKPLTNTVPKPLLKVGNKPIIEHNIDRHIYFGVDDFWISVGYLGIEIKKYFGSGLDKSVEISYINEEKPLGTIGAVRQIEGFKHDHILIMNSDILTNINYEDFYEDFIKTNADMAVVTIPYEVKVPYAVLETEGHTICDFKEKPTYTYYSNGGIYLIKKELLSLIPENLFYNATDLMDKLIRKGKKVHSFPLRGYWLDIGKKEDYNKAQLDIEHIQFK